MDTPASSGVDLARQLARMRVAHERAVPDYAQRRDDLKRLRAAFKARLDDFIAAMSADFGRRSRHESLLSDGMTVLNAVALAGGFSYRAKQSDFLLQRGGSNMQGAEVAGDTPLLPGDIVTVQERFF